MDECQHYEHFGLENDYDDGEFTDGEFFHKGKKQKRKQTTVNFTAGGTVLPSEELEKPKESEGLGFTPAVNHAGLGSGLGFTAEDEEQPEEMVEEDASLQKIKEAADEKRKEHEKQKEKEKSRKGGGKFKGTDKAEIGTSEHTKGIGMKLLEKMGYKGGGLGKKGQGIAAPVKVKMRRKQVGLGFDRDSEAAPEPVAKAEAVVEAVEKPKQNLWKRQVYQKIKRVYKTAAEVLAESENKNVGMTTILDMRGPQVRVLTNLERINDEAAMKENDIPLPELQHNLRLIVDLAEAEIETCDRQLRQERDSIVILHKDRDRLHEDAKVQERQMHALEAILLAIGECKKMAVLRTATLETLAEAFDSIQGNFPHEYKLYNMGLVALLYARPLMCQQFYCRDPLLMASHGVPAMKRWQGLLTHGGSSQFVLSQDLETETDPYTKLVKEAVLPGLRFSITNSWKPRDPEPLLQFLETWEGLLPVSVKRNILEHFMMPKLIAAVEEWDLRRETVPIHSWLHPWLPLLGSRMEALYPLICFKMAVALQAWHASDVSAHMLLSPWQRVFDAASWEDLTEHWILPKLWSAMHELIINPQHQVLDQFDWVMRWVGAVPTDRMVALLEAEFFPKWQDVLYHWLELPSPPDFSEVERWYLGWKSAFPPELHANKRVRTHFIIALDTINEALEGAHEKLSRLRAAEQRQPELLQQQVQRQPFPDMIVCVPPGLEKAGCALLRLKEFAEPYASQSYVALVHDGLDVYTINDVIIKG